MFVDVTVEFVASLHLRLLQHQVYELHEGGAHVLHNARNNLVQVGGDQP